MFLSANFTVIVYSPGAVYERTNERIERERNFVSTHRPVRHIARSIFVVFTLNFRFRRAFDGDRQTARAGVLRDDAKVARLVANAVAETRTVSGDITRLNLIDVKFEG